MNGTASSIRNSLESMNKKANVTIQPCRIVKVHRDKLTADVYIQEASGMVLNVPICFPSKGKGYGSYFMPRENSTYLLMYSNKKKPYILAYAPISVGIDGSGSNSEKLMPGENIIQSFGNAYSRQDIMGNNIASSQFGNENIQDANGVNRSSSLGIQENTIASKRINGFALTQSACLDREYLNQEDIKVFDYSEYYSRIEVSKVYKPDEIIVYAGTEVSIDQAIRQDIILATKDCLDKIDLFKSAVLIHKNNIQTMALSDSEVATAISDAYTELKNFNIIRKGVRMVVEKGNALNRRPNNISDVTKFKPEDFATRDGVDIVFRTTFEDSVSGLVKGVIQVDADGNCDLKFKSLNIDADEFTTTTPLVSN